MHKHAGIFVAFAVVKVKRKERISANLGRKCMGFKNPFCRKINLKYNENHSSLE